MVFFAFLCSYFIATQACDNQTRIECPKRERERKKSRIMTRIDKNRERGLFADDNAISRSGRCCRAFFGSVYSALDFWPPPLAHTWLLPFNGNAWAVNYEVSPPGRAPEQGVREREKEKRVQGLLLSCFNGT